MVHQKKFNNHSKNCLELISCFNNHTGYTGCSGDFSKVETNSNITSLIEPTTLTERGVRTFVPFAESCVLIPD